jgi:hypothetical protein
MGSLYKAHECLQASTCNVAILFSSRVPTSINRAKDHDVSLGSKAVNGQLKSPLVAN